MRRQRIKKKLFFRDGIHVGAKLNVLSECAGRLMLGHSIPIFAEAHMGIGITFKEIGLYDATISEYQTVLKIDPDYEQARLNLNTLLRKLPAGKR